MLPQMRTRVEAFLKAVAAAGLSIIITETTRSRERQEYLYSLGRTRPGRVVTWTMQSKHLTGEAVDVAFLRDGKVTYEGDWARLGVIGEKSGLRWGGRWASPDKPHFEFDPQWQQDHWALPYEQKLLDAGAVSYKKNLNEPVTRGELYVIVSRLHNL